MSIIPAGSKVMTVASTVDTNERKSTQANSPTQYYTVEDIIETVTGSTTAPTTTTVNISSAQIKSGSDITLLPDLPDGQYYDGYGILESTYGTLDYNFVDYGVLNIIQGDSQIAKYRCNNTSGILYDGFKNWSKFQLGVGDYLKDETLYTEHYNRTFVADSDFYTGVKMQWQVEAPTNGDGTIRFILVYTIRTFGA